MARADGPDHRSGDAADDGLTNPPLSGSGAICVSPTQSGCQGIVASGADLEFKPETNDAFELGAKYNGRGIDVNVAVFHQLFENFQLNTFNGLNFVVENINACKDDLDGADEDNSGVHRRLRRRALAPGVQQPRRRARSFHPADARTSVGQRRRGLCPTPAIARIWSAPTAGR